MYPVVNPIKGVYIKRMSKFNYVKLKWKKRVNVGRQSLHAIMLRKDFVILQLYWGCLVAQKTVAEIWSNAW